MKKILITFTLLFFGITVAFSQGELPEKSEIYYKDEKSYGVRLNTNGWSFNYRQGTFVNLKQKRLREFEFNTLRHIKETKRFPGESFRRYVYGKTNYCFDIRAGIGRQRRMYRKNDKGSVEIRLITFFGPSLGFLIPIYYEVYENNTTITEKYQPNHQPGTIFDRMPLYYGILETKLNPGLYYKLGISFEHGKYEKQLNAVEVGFTAFAYLRKMEIMAETNNNRFFVSFFINYRIGRVFHGGHHKSRNED